MFEVLSHYRSGIEGSEVLAAQDLSPRRFFVVSAHREENIDPQENFLRLLEVFNGVAERFQMPVIVSTHPRTRKRIESLDLTLHPEIRLLKPLGFQDYNKLQMEARAVLSDSGTISEESSILNFPALNIREAHERPEAMEEASVMMVGLSISRVLQALAIIEGQGRGEERQLRLVADYSTPNVSDKIVRILHSYTDYINRVVWRK
jgi:UDP-N-acetylglucosamine 2-epimerase (non-hydrolysing)